MGYGADAAKRAGGSGRIDLRSDTVSHPTPEVNGGDAPLQVDDLIQEALDANGKTKHDIDLLVPHQANLRISNYIQQKLGLPDEKVFNNIMYYGNTTAGTIPIALSEAFEQGKLKEGDLVCLAAFGSGFTWASALLNW